MALQTTSSSGEPCAFGRLVAGIKVISAMPLPGRRPTVVRIEGPLSQ